MESLSPVFVPNTSSRILQGVELTVIIVNYNVRYFLEQCLHTVLRALERVQGEVIVVDNASGDDSLSYLVPLFPSVRFLPADSNLGFAKANNHALSLAKGEYILFLNPDTLVPEDILRRCIDRLHQQPAIGALGVRMIDGKGKFLPESKRSFPSPWVAFAKLSGLGRLFPGSRVFNRYALGYLDPLQDHKVEVLAGACMFVRAALLRSLGGFDESYFLYGEDIDLSFRIQKAGYVNQYLASATLIHFKGESSRNRGFARLRHFYGAMQVFVQKHYNTGAARLFPKLLSVAIVLRAAGAAVERLLRPLLLPLADVLLLWLSLQATRTGWVAWVREGDDFKVPFIPVALVLFALVFAGAAALAGLYEKRIRTSRILTALVFAYICVLAAYALLPETVRFSRGVVMGGVLLGAMAVFLFRRALLAIHSRWVMPEEKTAGETVVVCAAGDYPAVVQMLEAAMEAPPLGRVSLRDEEPAALCTLATLARGNRHFAVNRILFCAGGYSWSDLIRATETKALRGKRMLFHTVGSGSMIGSQTLAPGATVVVPEIDYPLLHPYHRRMKRLLDVVISMLFLLFFPLHFLLHRRPLGLLRHSWMVLCGRYTWIGYGSDAKGLPSLRPGITTPLGDGQGSSQADALYAKHYDWWEDGVRILRYYRRL